MGAITQVGEGAVPEQPEMGHFRHFWPRPALDQPLIVTQPTHIDFSECYSWSFIVRLGNVFFFIPF